MDNKEFYEKIDKFVEVLVANGVSEDSLYENEIESKMECERTFNYFKEVDELIKKAVEERLELKDVSLEEMSEKGGLYDDLRFTAHNVIDDIYIHAYKQGMIFGAKNSDAVNKTVEQLNQ